MYFHMFYQLTLSNLQPQHTTTMKQQSFNKSGNTESPMRLFDEVCQSVADKKPEQTCAIVNAIKNHLNEHAPILPDFLSADMLLSPNDNLFDDILSSAKDGKWCECIKLLPLLRTRIAIAIVFAPKD